MTVKEYIQQNWDGSIRVPGSEEDKANFRMPVPYSTPCVSSLFTTFFYWDTYFANLGLLEDGRPQDAKNNLLTMRFFIKTLGFVPNAEHLITRTQPPLFTRGVYDYFKKTSDIELVKECLPAIEREMDFFFYDRMTPCGLNAFGTHESNTGKQWYYDEFNRRLTYTEAEKKLDKDEFVSGLLAIAESGWDFNPRFQKAENRFASRDFVHLDLNCILYDAERKAAELFRIVGDEAKGKLFDEKAEHRKQLINKYMLNPENGVYYDYDFKSGKFSSVVSGASLYPYALGISTDKVGAKNALAKLELPFGLAACEYRGEDEKYWQWDYPSMWPTNMYFAYEGLKNCGLTEDADRVMNKYLDTVDRCFEQTGELWEKYDAKNGIVSVTSEYTTPAMMGWTAGIYRYFQELKK